jgi:hypothetical protein
MTHPLPVNLDALARAFRDQGEDTSYYLNTETGELLTVLNDWRQMYDDIWAAAEDGGISFAEALARHDIAAWKKDLLASLDEIESGIGATYLEVPASGRITADDGMASTRAREWLRVHDIEVVPRE